MLLENKNEVLELNTKKQCVEWPSYNGTNCSHSARFRESEKNALEKCEWHEYQAVLAMMEKKNHIK